MFISQQEDDKFQKCFYVDLKNQFNKDESIPMLKVIKLLRDYGNIWLK